MTEDEDEVILVDELVEIILDRFDGLAKNTDFFPISCTKQRTRDKILGDPLATPPHTIPVDRIDLSVTFVRRISDDSPEE